MQTTIIPMTSKQRVYRALSHSRPDRVPRYIWLGNGLIRKLTAKYNCTPLELDIRIGNDVLQTWVSFNGEMARDVPDNNQFTDDFGITWRREGFYNIVVKHPLAGADTKTIMDYQLPNPLSPKRYETLNSLLSGYGDTHFIGADVSGTLFEPACYLRGMENVMLDLAEGSEETTALLDKLEAFGAAAAVECVRLGADWIWLGDDIGAQGGMMVSPDLWRAAIKPRLGRIIEAVRAQRPGAYIAYHSCGSMYQIIGDLAEIGVNVLNPIQESAAGMSQQTIKEQFGDRLTLMCGIDTQTFLPFRTPWEVTAETLRLCGALGSDGGFIFAVSHAVQHDTPMENIDAMISALWENNS